MVSETRPAIIMIASWAAPIKRRRFDPGYGLQGEICSIPRALTLELAVSIVNRNGLLVNAEGTPSHSICTPGCSTPLSGVWSLTLTSTLNASEIATSNSLGLHVGLPPTTVPFSLGIAAFFRDDSK